MEISGYEYDGLDESNDRTHVHGTETLLAICGTRSAKRRGECFWWCAGTRHVHWTSPEDSSPAQGGIQILGAVPGPQFQDPIVDKVADVSVIMVLKFQQSFLRFSSSTESRTFLWRFHSAVVGEVVDTPVNVSTTGGWSRQCRTVWWCRGRRLRRPFKKPFLRFST